MEDLFGGLLKRLSKFLINLLGFLYFLAWDLLFSYIGWTIGWSFLRVITFGRFPSEDVSDLERCSLVKALFIEVVGLAILGTLIYVISDYV